MKLFTDAAQTRKGFLVCFTDENFIRKKVVHLPNCNKSQLAEEEAIKLAIKEENVKTICSDNEQAIAKFANLFPNLTFIKVPRSENIANQVVQAYKENHHGRINLRTSTAK